MAIQIHTIKLGIVNVFVVPCKDGYLLVDSGSSHTYNQLLEKLHTMNISVDDIRYLLLTHNHEDHAGAAACLRHHNKNIRLIVHKNNIPFLEKGSGSIAGAQPPTKALTVFLDLYAKISPNEQIYAPLTIKPDDIVLDGDDFDVLSAIDIPGSIYYTPGHTNNHIVVIFQGGDVLCGDIAFNYRPFQIFGTGLHPILIQDKAEVYRSWQKIYQHGGKNIIPSHGEPFPITKLLSIIE